MHSLQFHRLIRAFNVMIGDSQIYSFLGSQPSSVNNNKALIGNLDQLVIKMYQGKILCLPDYRPKQAIVLVFKKPQDVDYYKTRFW